MLALPAGFEVRRIQVNRDARGCFAEIYRQSWTKEHRFVQWNFMHSRAGVLRGVRAHIRHDDWITLVSGRYALGLRDLRRDSPTAGLVTLIDIDEPSAVVVPHGVAHGMYYREDTAQIEAVSSYWDSSDELRCRWDDPGLAIPWSCQSPVLSAGDEHGTLDEMLALLEPHQNALGADLGGRPRMA